MLFNSHLFIIFLCVVLLLSRKTSSWTARKAFLLGMSYFFYATWSPPFVLLLWFSTLVDWVVAKRIYRNPCQRRKRAYLCISLLANLGLLAYFKYGTFLMDNFLLLAHLCRIEVSFHAMHILLPVGISFYTFQTLSYSLDVYRGTLKPGHSFIDYALYVSFFPQLVAGPIVRAATFLPQCKEEKKGSIKQLSWGLVLLVVGLFNKVVIADTLMGPIADKVFNASGYPNFIQAWSGTLAFSVQIFCDFSGYSSCAIGVALMLGFVLPDNFRFPYAALGFSDFWRRWHISLSTWLRDYLYFPLGGSKNGTLKTYVNLMLTMLIGGLWHGASWMFIIWGGLHALYLILERFFKRLTWMQKDFFKNEFPLFIYSIITFLTISFTWVFFRATDIKQALSISSTMLGCSRASHPGIIAFSTMNHARVYIIVVLMLFLHWKLRFSSMEEWVLKKPWWLFALVLSFMLYAILTSLGEGDNAFIYFQF